MRRIVQNSEEKKVKDGTLPRTGIITGQGRRRRLDTLVTEILYKMYFKHQTNSEVYKWPSETGRL